ncbi:hypothetical protein COLO4_22754 [Corchorus olitorius]|uniref:Uncharacterized protein n=1 Tax=Corchorus olitorius TaxID=93759 RepID=A0A1R3IKB4_9ROSI|nr:hypothetical protein COLO4_22754 [Corchorus olitorius]
MENPIQDIPVDIEVDLNSASPSTHAGNQGLSIEPTSVVVENDETRKRAFTSKVWEHVTRQELRVVGLPEKSDWENARALCVFLKKLYILTCKVSAIKSVTSTNLLDEVWGVHRTLLQLQNHTNMLVGINEALKDIFEDYVKVMNPAATSSQSSQVQQSSLMEDDDDYDAMAEFQKHQMESGGDELKTELDIYLQEEPEMQKKGFAAGMDTGSVDWSGIGALLLGIWFGLQIACCCFFC